VDVLGQRTNAGRDWVVQEYGASPTPVSMAFPLPQTTPTTTVTRVMATPTRAIITMLPVPDAELPVSSVVDEGWYVRIDYPC
jgi:hypothetical protein